MIQQKDANTKRFNEVTISYLEEFQDKETRHIYVDEFLNAKIATQIKVLREQQGMSQAELAEKAGMKQERISVLEDINYSAWTLNTLRRIAEAFDLRINLSFEDFGSFLDDFSDFNRITLERNTFAKDAVFSKTFSEDRKNTFSVMQPQKTSTKAGNCESQELIRGLINNITRGQNINRDFTTDIYKSKENWSQNIKEAA